MMITSNDWGVLTGGGAFANCSWSTCKSVLKASSVGRPGWGAPAGATRLWCATCQHPWDIHLYWSSQADSGTPQDAPGFQAGRGPRLVGGRLKLLLERGQPRPRKRHWGPLCRPPSLQTKESKRKAQERRFFCGTERAPPKKSITSVCAWRKETSLDRKNNQKKQQKRLMILMDIHPLRLCFPNSF